MPLPAHFPNLNDYIGSKLTADRGRRLYESEMCHVVERSEFKYRFTVEDRFEDYEVFVSLANQKTTHACTCVSRMHCCHHAAAVLILLRDSLSRDERQRRGSSRDGEVYNRDEMIDRVLREREERAKNEAYEFTFADNIYGIHEVQTAAGRTYQISFRDFEEQTGYCSCPDFKTNKLATCKHLIAARRDVLKKLHTEKLLDTQPYPFVEVYCDPRKDYDITYFYRGNLSVKIAALVGKYFNEDGYVMPENYAAFVNFVKEAEGIKKILIRPEVQIRLDRHFDEVFCRSLSDSVTPDFDVLKLELHPYQKDGVLFSLFKQGTIIADEMGLGKTAQAIAISILKKQIFGVKRVFIICPASLKQQWESEIARFSDETVSVIQGTPAQRAEMYLTDTSFFLIMNYETVVRDVDVIRRCYPDMIILDEAQRIKNYTTKTSYAVKSIPKKHALVLTGTPLENRLGDLYSIMNFIDPKILAPLWEFSMNHCFFDKSKKEKITGYYNLRALKQRLEPWVVRRERQDVLGQLPEVQEMTIPVALHPAQAEIHNNLSRSLASILGKKYFTAYDMQRMQRILASMRMVCNSTFLVDRETNISPKLDELEEILLDKLDVISSGRKVLIFSEWTTMLHLIEKMIQLNEIGYVLLSGKVPVKKRKDVIDEFRDNSDCQVMLASEVAGTGLNLQFADTVINFELPWNPARKKQRIGRVNRLGQKSKHITVINLVTTGSIEERIAAGIELKDSLFDAVLSEREMTDQIDFKSRGQATFIQQVEKLVVDEQYQTDGETLEEMVPRTDRKGDEELAVFAEDVSEDRTTERLAESSATSGETAKRADPAFVATPEMQVALNQGLQFLNGLMKIATGKEIATEGQSIRIDHETGEVTMKFKLPMGEE